MKKSGQHVRHSHSYALLIIDMLNPLDFPGSKKLLVQAKPIAQTISRLKERAQKSGIPVLYVNDNFGQWRSEWSEVYKACSSEDSMGRELATALKPNDEDYFILKPKHSGFYSTTLEILLRQLGTRHLIMTGVATDICVLFTAHDAHMREYEITVPRDCVAANTKRQTEVALEQMRIAFGVNTPFSKNIKFSKTLRQKR